MSIPSALSVARKYADGGAVPIESEKKIDRSAFVYLNPKEPGNKFAQCGTCFMFTGTGCIIHDRRIRITKDMTCALYVHGDPLLNWRGKEKPYVTPEESGLANFQVRCENCKYGGEHCGLFKMLNKSLPDAFDLDTKIDPKGCCNAFMQKSDVK